MTYVRVLQTAQVVLSHTFYVDEAPTDAVGSVTCSVKRLDGTVVTSGTASGPVSHVYTFTVPAQTQLDMLTLDWTGTVAGASVTARDYIEIVGGYIFGLAEARAMPPVLDVTRYPTDKLAQKRIGVEQECEEICGQAFVPRFARIKFTLDSQTRGTTLTSKMLLPSIQVRALRAITIDGVTQTLTGVTVSSAGVLRGLAWTGTDLGTTIIVEYEHGLDYPPEDLKDACMLRLRSRLSQGDSGVPQRALSFSVADGGVYRLSTPSGAKTGIPDVDGVYERYTFDRGGFA